MTTDHFGTLRFRHKEKTSHQVGLISLGTIDEKIPLVLSILLLSTDIALNLYQNSHFPLSATAPILEDIKRFLLNIEGREIVFDLRVQDWKDFQSMKKSREFAHTLQEICSSRQMSSSAILSSGSQQLGNLLGLPFETFEARQVLEGMGPPELIKFALEIGSDFLLLTKRARHKMEANIFLKEKIVSGEVSRLARKILGTASPYHDQKITKRIYAPKKGYFERWVPEKLLTIKNEFFSSYPGSGFSLLKKHGDQIKKGDEIAEAYILEGQQKFWSDEVFKGSFIISTYPPDFRPFILERQEMRFL